MGRVLQQSVIIWALLAFVGWGLIFALQGAITFPQIGYYLVLLLLVGTLIWRNRARLQVHLQRWNISPFLRFLLLGYGMVLLEEIIAAFFNHLLEGFDLGTFPLRIGQFWAFNIFAFTGLIVGWYLLRRFIPYTPREAFFLTGCFGLIAEHTVNFLAGNILIFFLLAPLNILTYGLILTPAQLSLPDTSRRNLPMLLRYVLAIFVPFCASIVPVLILMVLRAHFPAWFPPCRFISCS